MSLVKNNRRPYLLNLAVLALVGLLSVAIGAVFIPPGSLLDLLWARLSGAAGAPAPAAFETILFRIRLPHTALVALTGAALAGSGAAYQGLFRNPLADPYLIGVASGAGLGAVTAMAFEWPDTLAGLVTVPAAAFAGAIATVALVSTLARREGDLPTTTLLLAGVAVSSFATALTSYLMLRSQGELRRAIVWLLGGSPLTGWEPVLAALPYTLLGLALLLASGHALNVLQFGESQARQLGLSVSRAKLLVVVAASLAAAAAVAFSGVIGFIGLIVPHVVRLVWGPDYRRLIPLSILGGASALLAADLLARLVLAPQALPVGVITALAGAPFFLWVLRRARAQEGW
jgi:iron complex transport system permease protein